MFEQLHHHCTAKREGEADSPSLTHVRQAHLSVSSMSKYQETSLVIIFLYLSVFTIFSKLGRAQRLELKVRSLSGHREHTKRVGVPKTALPALDGDDGATRRDDVELQRVAQSEANTVINLIFRGS